MVWETLCCYLRTGTLEISKSRHPCSYRTSPFLHQLEHGSCLSCPNFHPMSFEGSNTLSPSGRRLSTMTCSNFSNDLLHSRLFHLQSISYHCCFCTKEPPYSRNKIEANHEANHLHRNQWVSWHDWVWNPNPQWNWQLIRKITSLELSPLHCFQPYRYRHCKN